MGTEPLTTRNTNRDMLIPMQDSIRSLHAWSMGSLYICERYRSTEPAPLGTELSWSDGNTNLCLRRRPRPLKAPEGTAIDQTVQVGVHGGIWMIGESTMVKVTAWYEGIQLEGRTIRSINTSHPEIPTTEVFHEWIDHGWNRSFMVMRKAPGMLLDLAWKHMNTTDKENVAKEVAHHVKNLTCRTSEMLETIDRHGVGGCKLVGLMPFNQVPQTPVWKQWIHPRFDPTTFRRHLRDQSRVESCPELESHFILYNTDITTHNLFVQRPQPSAGWKLAQIIDWEQTAYWPRFWIATCPLAHPAFRLHDEPDGDWGKYLSIALNDVGFDSEAEWYSKYSASQRKLRDEAAGPEYWSFLAELRAANIRRA